MADNRIEQAGRTAGRAGLAMMLPLTMAASPIVGFLLGGWLGRKIGWEDLKFVGLLFGIVLAVKEVIEIVRRLQDSGPRNPPDSEEK